MKTLRLLMVAIILVGCMLMVTKDAPDAKAQSLAVFPVLASTSSDTSTDIHFKVTVTAWVEGRFCKYQADQECIYPLRNIYTDGEHVVQELAKDSWYLICLENGIGP